MTHDHIIVLCMLMKKFDATSELWSTLVIFLQQRIEYRNYSIVYLKRWDVVKYCQIARPILLSSDFLKKGRLSFLRHHQQIYYSQPHKI